MKKEKEKKKCNGQHYGNNRNTQRLMEKASLTPNGFNISLNDPKILLGNRMDIFGVTYKHLNKQLLDQIVTANLKHSLLILNIYLLNRELNARSLR